MWGYTACYEALHMSGWVWRTPFLVLYNYWAVPRNRIFGGFTGSIAWKVSEFRVFSGPRFPIFALNAEIDRVNSGK